MRPAVLATALALSCAFESAAPDEVALGTLDASGAPLGRERDALWRGVVAHYDAW